MPRRNFRKRVSRRPRRRTLRRTRVPRQPRNGRIVLLRRTADAILRNNDTASGTVTVGYAGGLTLDLLQAGSPVSNGMGSYDIPFSLQFYLDDLYGYTDITDLCDRYMIDKVWIRCTYQMGGYSNVPVVSSLFGQNPILPTIRWYFDPGDSTPSSVQAMGERMGTKFAAFQPGKVIKMSCRPRFQLYGRDNVPSAVVAYSKRGFIDSAHPDIPHYAIKGIVGGMALPDADLNSEIHGVRFDVCMRIIGIGLA